MDKIRFENLSGSLKTLVVFAWIQFGFFAVYLGLLCFAVLMILFGY